MQTFHSGILIAAATQRLRYAASTTNCAGTDWSALLRECVSAHTQEAAETETRSGMNG